MCSSPSAEPRYRRVADRWNRVRSMMKNESASETALKPPATQCPRDEFVAQERTQSPADSVALRDGVLQHPVIGRRAPRRHRGWSRPAAHRPRWRSRRTTAPGREISTNGSVITWAVSNLSPPSPTMKLTSSSPDSTRLSSSWSWSLSKTEVIATHFALQLAGEGRHEFEQRAARHRLVLHFAPPTAQLAGSTQCSPRSAASLRPSCRTVAQRPAPRPAPKRPPAAALPDRDAMTGLLAEATVAGRTSRPRGTGWRP